MCTAQNPERDTKYKSLPPLGPVNDTFLEGILLEGTLLQGTLLAGTLLKGTFLEGTLLEGALLDGTLQKRTLQETALQEGFPGRVPCRRILAKRVPSKRRSGRSALADGRGCPPGGAPRPPRDEDRLLATTMGG